MKLQKNTKKYLIILYAIWELFTYYARLFKLDVPSDATKLPVKLSVDEDNVTHLIIEMPSSRIPDPYYTGDSMKTIFNEYLNIVLLPSQKELSPFAGGNSVYDIVDCIYVYQAHVLTTGYTYIDVIYVDNMQAFRMVKNDRKIMEI